MERKRWRLGLFTLFALSALAVAAPASAQTAKPGGAGPAVPAPPRGVPKDFSRHYRYPVHQVISGDLVTIRVGRRVVRMRVLGVSAPHPDARKLLRELLEGEAVFLEYGPLPRPHPAGDWMAYLYRARDALFINGELVARGYALAADHPGQHTKLLESHQESARREAAGLWRNDQLVNFHTVRSPEFLAGVEATRRMRRDYLEGLRNWQLRQAYPELALAAVQPPPRESSASVKLPTAAIEKSLASTRDDGVSDRIVLGQLGKVARNSRLQGKPSVVVFEEVHTSPKVQIEIALMLHRLFRDQGMRRIALEGYVKGSAADARWFHELPFERPQKLRVATRLLADGEISSAEFMVLLFPEVSIHPIEDAAQYAVELEDEDGDPVGSYVNNIVPRLLSQEQLQEVSRLQRQGSGAEVSAYLSNVCPWFEKISKLLKMDGGRALQVEELVALVDELGRKAAEVGCRPAEKDQKALLALRKFYQTASDRSQTMVAATLEVGQRFPERPIALIIGAAHTWNVGQLLDESRQTYGVIRPASMDVKERPDDLDMKAFRRKGLALSVDEEGLGALLDGRKVHKKPPPVISERWFQAKTMLYALADQTTLALATEASAGTPPSRRKPPGELNLGQVRVDPRTVQHVGVYAAFKADVFPDDPVKKLTVGVWGKPLARPKRAPAPGGDEKREIEAALLAIRGASEGGGQEPPSGPEDQHVPKPSAGDTTPPDRVSSETIAVFSTKTAPPAQQSLVANGPAGGRTTLFGSLPAPDQERYRELLQIDANTAVVDRTNTAVVDRLEADRYRIVLGADGDVTEVSTPDDAVNGFLSRIQSAHLPLAGLTLQFRGFEEKEADAFLKTCEGRMTTERFEPHALVFGNELVSKDVKSALTAKYDFSRTTVPEPTVSVLADGRKLVSVRVEAPSAQPGQKPLIGQVGVIAPSDAPPGLIERIKAWLRAVLARILPGIGVGDARELKHRLQEELKTFQRDIKIDLRLHLRANSRDVYISDRGPGHVGAERGPA